MIRAISYGGGVQSTALLVLAARREIDFPLAVFANTGDDSEAPETLVYIRDVARPYAEAHGIELVEVQHHRETLYANTMRQKGVTIPMRLPSGAPANRGCTRDWKVMPIAKELRQRGATPDAPAVLAMGISIDEWHRMKPPLLKYERFEYPLIDRRIDRAGCEALIARAGLPVPPKSACWFCPFTSPERWQQIRKSDPARFKAAVAFERDKNAQLVAEGKDPVYLTRFLKPLDEAIPETGQLDLFDDGMTCDVAGYCAA